MLFSAVLLALLATRLQGSEGLARHSLGVRPGGSGSERKGINVVVVGATNDVPTNRNLRSSEVFISYPRVPL